MESCEKYQELMSLYIDNEMMENERFEFEKHLEACENCREELDCLGLLISDVNHLPQMLPPENFHKQLMEAIYKEQPNKNKTSPWSGFDFRSYVPVAASVLVCFVILGTAISTLGGRVSQSLSENLESAYYQYGMSTDKLDVYSTGAEMAGGIAAATDTEETETGGMPAPTAGSEGVAKEVIVMPEAATIHSATVSSFMADENDQVAQEAFGAPETENTQDQSMLENSQSINAVSGTARDALPQATVADTEVIAQDIYLNIIVDDVNSAINQVKALPLSIESTRIGTEYADLNLSVSQADYSWIVENIKYIGECIQEQAYVYDLTDSVFDNETRYLAKRNEIARLVGLIEKAVTAEDVVKLEVRIDELESDSGMYRAAYTGDVKRTQNPTIRISFVQRTKYVPKVNRTFGEKVVSAFIQSINLTTTGFESFAVLLSYLSVPIVVIIIVVIACLFLKKTGKGGNRNV